VLDLPWKQPRTEGHLRVAVSGRRLLQFPIGWPKQRGQMMLEKSLNFKLNTFQTIHIKNPIAYSAMMYDIKELNNNKLLNQSYTNQTNQSITIT